MRVALTKGTLQIPPTYFAVEHALALPQITWHYFVLAANVTDQIPIPITEVTPAAASFSLKEKLKYATLPLLQGKIEQWKPDLIHQHMVTWSRPAQKAAKSLGVPLVTTLHGTDVFAADANSKHPLTKWNQYNARTALENSDVVVAVSKYLADRALERGAGDVKVIYQGIDTEFFHPLPPAEREALEGRPRRIVFVGALNDQKGILQLIEASLALIGSHEHELVIVGDGPYRQKVSDYAKRFGHISYLGSLPRAGTREALQHSDFLVLPTRTWHNRQEAAGLVLLEAQACGLPVIAHAVGGTPEMMDADLNWLTDENDPDSIRNALREALELPATELGDRHGEVRQWVVKNRASQRWAQVLRELYQSLV